MDPGTALGVVSLGLQVCQGLLDYYQAWDGYLDDIRETCDGIASLNKTLLLLGDALQTPQAASLSTDLASRVAECITTCQGGITRLDNKLTKLHKETPKGFRQKVEAGGLRLVYPFRKSTLEKFKETVQQLQQDLNLAIQVLQLDSAGKTLNTVSRVENQMGIIEDLTTRIDNTTLETQIKLGVTADGVRALLTEQEAVSLRNILKWLSAPDPTTNHEESRRRYEPGTGEWLLKCQEYQDWVLGRFTRLWLHGKAGCCKTVLCSSIIEDVQIRLRKQSRTKCVCIYFYFSFTDTRKQSYVGLLLYMVSELSRGSAVHPALLAAYENCQPNEPGVGVLEGILVALLRQRETSYLVIDALDECPQGIDGQREQIMEGLRRVTQQAPGARVLISSRPEMDIEDFMRSWCDSRLALNKECVNADIDLFVKSSLTTDKKLMRLPAETKKEIEDMFHEKSDGMFRWAALQLDSIRNLKILRPKYISAALYAMPRTLDKTYERILATIDELYEEEAQTVLAWLAFSERPLSVAELAEACSIRLDNSDDGFVFEEGGEEVITGLVGVISSLVIVENGPLDLVDIDAWQSGDSEPGRAKFNPIRLIQQVRLAHFSVKEYLTSSRLLQDTPRALSKFGLVGGEAHGVLAQSCCAYLLHFTSRSDVSTWIEEEKLPRVNTETAWMASIDEDFLVDFASVYPLLTYAVRYWNVHQAAYEHHHSSGSGSGSSDSHTLKNNDDDNNNFSGLHVRLLGDDRVRISWLRLVDPLGYQYAAPETAFPRGVYENGALQMGAFHDGTTPLYWAALLALDETFASLCGRSDSLRADLHNVAGKFGTAMQAAAYSGSDKSVHQLIRAGADVNIEGGYYGTSLQAAAHSGHEKVSEMLIRHGANVNSFGGEYLSALIAAAHCPNKDRMDAYEKIVQMLLQAGATPNVDPDDEHYKAAATKHALSRNMHCQTALSAAVEAGHDKIVQKLLQAGANIDVLYETLDGSRTALYTAVAGRQENIAHMLIQNGADVKVFGRSKYGAATIPLLAAVQHDDKNMAKMLIQAGADITGDRGQEAFKETTKRAWRSFDIPPGESMAALLLLSGLDVHAQCQPLIFAALAGFEGVVAMLLEANVDIHGHGSFSYDDYSFSKRDYEPSSGNALMAAAGAGHESVVALLLDAGAKVNDWTDPTDAHGDAGYATALTQAVGFCIETWADGFSSRGFSIVRKLLDAGADIHAGGDAALYKAVHYKKEPKHNHDPASSIALAQLLLANGADVSGQYSVPDGLHSRHSIVWGATDVGVVKILLDHGAEINDPGGDSHRHDDDDDRQSVLYRAAAIGDKEVVRLLLDHGANVDFVDASEGMALATASFDFQHYEDLDYMVITVMILDAMLDAKGRDATVFETMLGIPDGGVVWRRYVRSALEKLVSETPQVRYDTLERAETKARIFMGPPKLSMSGDPMYCNIRPLGST